jgi:hypothetical protein
MDRLKRGVFRSIVDLELTINRFAADINTDPGCSIGRRSMGLAGNKRGKQTLESIH